MLCTSVILDTLNISETGVATNVSSRNVTLFPTLNFTLGEDVLEEHERFRRVEHVMDRFVTPTICMFGIAGNGLNIGVLTRKSVMSHINRL